MTTWGIQSIPFVPKETEANIADGLHIYIVQVWSQFSWETVEEEGHQ